MPMSEEEDTLDFPAFSRLEPAAAAQCPLGTLLLKIAWTMLCVMARDAACYTHLNVNISRQLFNIPLTVIMGTEWPIYALLHTSDWAWPGTPPHSDYECDRSNGSDAILNWPLLRRAFWDDRPHVSWWSESVKYVFDKALVDDFYRASRQCLYGVYVMNMVKAMWATDTESSSYDVYAPYVQWILYESLHYLGASGWPIFALLHHFTSLRRHGFRLDYIAAELGGMPYREHGEWLQSLPLERHLALIDAMPPGRPHFSATVRALRAALQHSDGLRVVYVTMVYGRFNQYISGWAKRARRLGLQNLVMAALDDEAFELCTQHLGATCVRGSVSVLNKYTLLLVALQLGIDVMWLDFDIFLVRNPGPVLQTASQGYDLLMGYDYDSDCLCNGFFYLRSRPITHRWLFEMVRWLYDHPYEHDQRAMSAFLNYTEKIALGSDSLPEQPRWFVFDVNNQFINFGSWEGGFQDLVLVHFVDGSAFSLYGRQEWDPSIPQTKRRVAVDVTNPGVERTAMDFFYQPGPIDSAPETFFQLRPELRRLLEAQRRPRPKQKQRCGILPAVETAHSGYGWLVDAGAKAWAQTSNTSDEYLS